MIQTPDIKEKFDTSYKLLTQDTTDRERFEEVRKLIQGFNPRVDKHLAIVSKALATYYKIQSGDLIDLTAEALPETTEEEKKRKKALLLLIHSWEQLQGEVNRIRHELSLDQLAKHTQSRNEKILHIGNIVKYAKGPFGIITLGALVIVGVSLFISSKMTSTSANIRNVLSPTQTIVTHGPKIQGIVFNSKKIPLTQLRVGIGPDCGVGGIPHYHALLNEKVIATDGTILPDPGGCGFGRVSQTSVVDIE